MGTQAQIQKTQEKQINQNGNKINNIANSQLLTTIQHPNISNNVMIEQSKETNDYRICLIINVNSYWKKSYNSNTSIVSIIKDYKKEMPLDFPLLNEIQLYINQTLIDPNVTLSSIAKKGIPKSELTLTYNIIGVEDFVFDSVNYLKHEIHFIGKPFPNPFTLLIFSRKDKAFKAAEFTLDSINKSGISSYSNLSSYCNGKNCLFLSGGEKGVLLNDFWEIDLISQVIERHPLGIIPKKQHGMVYIPKNIVFMVGGSDKSTLCYNIKKKEMERWADLNTEHIEPALAIIDNKYLYAFSNCKIKNLMFERTNLRSLPKWDKIVPIIGNYLQFNQKFFGVCEENEESLIFLGGNILEYDSNSQIDKYCFVYNHKANKLNESNTKFEEFNLGEKTFLPFNSKFSFIIPNVGMRDTKLLIYNKKKEKIDVLKFEIPKQFFHDNKNINNNEFINKDGWKSTMISKKYLFKLPQLEEKNEINNIMAQSQIGNKMNISNMLNAKEENNYTLFKDNFNQTNQFNEPEYLNNKQEIQVIKQKDNLEENTTTNQKHKEKEDNDQKKNQMEILLINNKEDTDENKNKLTDDRIINQHNNIKISDKDSNDMICEEKKQIEPIIQKEVVMNNDKKPKEKVEVKTHFQKGIVTIINNKKNIIEDKKCILDSIEKPEKPFELNALNANPVNESPDKNKEINQKGKHEKGIELTKPKEIKDNSKIIQEIIEQKPQEDSKMMNAKENKNANSLTNNTKEQPKVDTFVNSKKDVNLKESIQKEIEQKRKNEKKLNNQEIIKDILIIQKAETTTDQNTKPNIIQNEQQRQNKFDVNHQEDAKQKEDHQSSISQTRVELKQSGSMVRSSLIKGFGDKKKEIQLSGLPQVTKHKSPIQKSKVEISGTLNKETFQQINKG